MRRFLSHPTHNTHTLLLKAEPEEDLKPWSSGFVSPKSLQIQPQRDGVGIAL